MQPDHGSRSHATWSASSTARHWACAGALHFVARLNLPDKESEAAAWGTACHQVAEKCLNAGFDAVDLIGRIERTKEHTFEVDDEMAECAQAYVDYVRQAAVHTDKIAIEQKFTLASLNPPFDAGGTGDAVIYTPDLKLLEVVDLKGGRGTVVEVKGNPQLRTYALGAILANPGYDVERVQVTIVQPRAPHKDGRIRSEIFHVTDLMEWTADLLAKMRESKEAADAYELMPQAAWAAKYLSPGPHCEKTFCKAHGACPAAQQAAMDKAGLWFDDLDKPRLANRPETMSPEEIARMLDAADEVESYFKALRAYAHGQAEMGVEIPSYILTETQGRRKWKGEPDEVITSLKDDLFLTDDQIYGEPKLKSPAQVEKVLGAKRKGQIEHLWETPITGKNLVRADKTSRKAVAPAVNQHFEVLE